MARTPVLRSLHRLAREHLPAVTLGLPVEVLLRALLGSVARACPGLGRARHGRAAPWRPQLDDPGADPSCSCCRAGQGREFAGSGVHAAEEMLAALGRA